MSILAQLGGKDAAIKTVDDTYAKIKASHQMHLEDHGVILPELKNEKTGDYNLRALQLVYLAMHLDQQVSKEDIAEFVKIFQPDAAGDQQARHLSYAGWDVRGSGRSKGKHKGTLVAQGHYVLITLEHPNTKFISKALKRQGRAAAKDWSELVAAYGDKCACCGKEQDPDLFEKGHKDPRKGQEIDNLIPQCGDCNVWASDRFIFNDDGRIIGLASHEFVLQSDDDIQRQIWLALKKKFK